MMLSSLRRSTSKAHCAYLRKTCLYKIRGSGRPLGQLSIRHAGPRSIIQAYTTTTDEPIFKLDGTDASITKAPEAQETTAESKESSIGEGQIQISRVQSGRISRKERSDILKAKRALARQAKEAEKKLEAAQETKTEDQLSKDGLKRERTLKRLAERKPKKEEQAEGTEEETKALERAPRPRKARKRATKAAGEGPNQEEQVEGTKAESKPSTKAPRARKAPRVRKETKRATRAAGEEPKEDEQAEKTKEESEPLEKAPRAGEGTKIATEAAVEKPGEDEQVQELQAVGRKLVSRVIRDPFGRRPISLQQALRRKRFKILPIRRIETGELERDKLPKTRQIVQSAEQGSTLETRRSLLSALSKIKLPSEVKAKVMSELRSSIQEDMKFIPKETVTENSAADTPGRSGAFFSIKEAMHASRTGIDTPLRKSEAPNTTKDALKKPGTNPYKVETVVANDLLLSPLIKEQPPVPRLAYGLERVLFNPGVYQLQDPRSRVFNFDPYLQKIMPAEEFDFNALKSYVTSSKDKTLLSTAAKAEKKYTGSTSSMTSALAHFHFLLSNWRPVKTGNLSKNFPAGMDTFTAITRAPSSVFVRYKDGVYAIDADKEYDSANILMMLGKSLEKLLTLPTDDFEKYRKTNSDQLSEDSRNEPESFHYSTMGDFLMRSQLDAYDPRLPGTGMFDLKTRAVASIRFDMANYKEGTGYELRSRHGEYESYEREYYDMIRAAFLKYSLQVRMGRMDGIFVAFHNIQRLFGFQYISISEMDYALHGSEDTTIGDSEFKLSITLLNKILDRATARFPKQSLRIYMETRPSKAEVPYTYIFVRPVKEDDIEKMQNKAQRKIQKFEEDVLGIKAGDEDIESQKEAEWKNTQEIIEESVDDDDIISSDSASVTEQLDDQETVLRSRLIPVDEGEINNEGVIMNDEAAGEDETIIDDEAVDNGNIIEDEAAEHEATEHEAVMNKVAEDEATEHEAIVDEVAEDKATEHEAVVNEVAEDKATEHEAVADEVAEDKATEHEAVVNEVAEDKATEHEAVADEVAEDKATEHEAVVDEVAEDKATEHEAVVDVGEDEANVKYEGITKDDAGGKKPLVEPLNRKTPTMETFGMILTVRNKVNGEYVARPDDLEASDKWSVEYALAEIEESRVERLFQSLRNRRRLAMESKEESQRSAYFDRFLKPLKEMSKEGHARRQKQEELDKTRPVHVLDAEPTNR
ncbi:hypothetical protein PVAG01_00607 [Phlyctema vagabunda]|uniref:Uncharacterized protein n=1 Tax=Phlyctema vagabunda TaxID=108571 RepID=A0ABR4PUR6_9HELO